MNQSVHAIDLLQWIAGPVARVSAYAASRIHPKIEVEDTMSASLRFESGAFGTIMGTTAMFPGSPVRIEIGGENGTAVSEGGLKTYKFRDERPEDKELLDRVNAASAGQARGAGAAADIGLDLHARNIDVDPVELGKGRGSRDEWLGGAQVGRDHQRLVRVRPPRRRRRWT